MKTLDYVLVEDNKNDIELIVENINEVLPAEGHVIEDGNAALEHAEKLVEDKNIPRLIILDLKLPKHSGFELLKFLKDHEGLRHIPVVVLTSSHSDKDMEKCYLYGANAYVVKPIGYDDFERAIRGIASFWLEQNNPPQTLVDRR